MSKPPADQAKQQQRDIVLAGARTVCKFLETIREEVALTGVALSNDAIDPQTAIRWIDEIAPGCLHPQIQTIFQVKGWKIT